jgi:PGF-pre-PGF domain-containing protein
MKKGVCILAIFILLVIPVFSGASQVTVQLNKSWDSMSNDITHSFEPTGFPLIQKIILTPNKDLTNITLNLISFDSKPKDLTEPDQNALYYFDIEKNILNQDLKNTTITFALDKDFIDLNTNKNNIVIERYLYGKWIPVSIKFLEEKNNKYFYEAETPDLTYFAIASKPLTEDQKQISLQQAKDLKQESKVSNKFVIIAILLIIILLISAYIVIKKLKPKHKHHKDWVDGFVIRIFNK